LGAQIPKAPKKTDNFTVFFALLGSAYIKTARKMLMKLTPADTDVKQFGSQKRRADNDNVTVLFQQEH
jgi:hypothetical protein